MCHDESSTYSQDCDKGCSVAGEPYSDEHGGHKEETMDPAKVRLRLASSCSCKLHQISAYQIYIASSVKWAGLSEQGTGTAHSHHRIPSGEYAAGDMKMLSQQHFIIFSVHLDGQAQSKRQRKGNGQYGQVVHDGRIQEPIVSRGSKESRVVESDHVVVDQENAVA